MSDPVVPGPGSPAPEPVMQDPQHASTASPYAMAAVHSPRGRAVAIAAMAVGLTSLVTAFVAVLYLPIAFVIAAGLAVAAVVLGGVAIARRGPRTPGVTGLVSGALAILIVLITVALGAGNLGVQALMGAFSGAAQANGFSDGSTSEGGEDVGAQVDVEWPANLATGGIMFTRGDADELRVLETEKLPDNSFPDVSEFTSEDGTSPDRIQLYLDYRCPACLTFETTNGEALERAASGGAVVELQPLTFLDHASAGSYYSSRAAGAMACLAERQPDDAWAAHRALLAADFQPAPGVPGPDNDAILNRIEGTVGVLNDEARFCIQDEQHVTFAQALSNWISTNPVPRAEDPTLRVAGTPLAVVNGVAFSGDISNPAAFEAFLAQQGVTLT